MADGDHLSVVMPPQGRTVDRNEIGSFTRLGTPLPQRPDLGNKMVVQTDDYDIIIDTNNLPPFPSPAIRETPEQKPGRFGDNLALELNDNSLNLIANEVLEGVEADVQARQGWIDQYTKGLDLLSQKIDDQGQQGGSQKRFSRAGEPLMIEAMVKYGAGASAELLPAGGPAKVETIGTIDPAEEERAKDFQDDFNYLLTEVMREYYPDTGSMLMHQGYCGLGFKKIFRDPIKRRPTSLSVLAPDLAVSEEATDLDTALRVTHIIQMLKGDLRRMQLVGHYRDINIGTPQGAFGLTQQAQRAIRGAQGLGGGGQNMRPQDLPYEIYETDVALDVDDMGIDLAIERKTPWGLPLPYKIAVEKNSRQTLGIWRNWDEGDDLYLKNNMFVKYGMIDSLNFYSWGFLQLLGNQTRVLRACLRLLIDAGMFSLFPGGMKLKQGRMSTNEIAPQPGEFVDIEYTGANPDISKLVMPMPYKGPDAVFVQLYEMVRKDAQALAGTVMLEVGEGRTNMPVGTVLAAVEQQVQIMAGVYKHNHWAQRDEFHKLRKLFAQNPSDLSRLTRGRPIAGGGEPRIWELASEFMDLNLVPASDPNVPGRVHAIMMANVLILLAQNSPELYDKFAVNKIALQSIGANADIVLKRPEQLAAEPPPPDPKVVAAQIKAQSETEKTQAKSAELALDAQVKREELAAHASEQAAANQTERQVAQLRHEADMHKHDADIRKAEMGHQADLTGQVIQHHADASQAATAHQVDLHKQQTEHQEAARSQRAGHVADREGQQAKTAADLQREQAKTAGAVTKAHTEAALRPPEPNPFGSLT